MTSFFSAIISLSFLLSSSNVFAQDTLLNKYGLWVVSSVEEYKKTIA